MAHDIHWEPHGVYKKYVGHVTGEEFLEAVERVNAHPAFDRFRYVINDFTACASVDIDAALQELAVAAALGAQRSNSRFAAAFVAADNAILSRINAIAASVKGEMTVRIFQNLNEARHWADSL
jgi:hypothetical protein